MKRFVSLFGFAHVRQELKSLNRDAALDSLRNVLAVLGLGTLLGDFTTMRVFYVLPCAALGILVWYADYLRHDFPVPPLYVEGDPELLKQIEELGR